MMSYKGYLGKVEFDAAASILTGEVLGIRDVITFQGRSVMEVENAFRESVDDYLAFCQQRGEEPAKPCSGKFMVRIDSELHRRTSLVAQSTGQSLNSLVAESLVRVLAERIPHQTRGSGPPTVANRKSRPSKPPKFR